MNINEEEKVVAAETFRAMPGDDPRAASLALPTPVMIDAVGERQAVLLRAVEAYVPRETLDLLRAKAALEMRLLRELLARGARSASARKEASEVLRRGFFRLQRLDPHAFE